MATITVGADQDPAIQKNQFCSYIADALYWNVAEKVSSASLCVPRVFETCTAETLRSHPESVHQWLQNWITSNKAAVELAIDGGLKEMMGLNDPSAEKYPSIMGSVNGASVALPKPWVGKPVSKVFLRISEVGNLY